MGKTKLVVLWRKDGIGAKLFFIQEGIKLANLLGVPFLIVWFTRPHYNCPIDCVLDNKYYDYISNGFKRVKMTDRPDIILNSIRKRFHPQNVPPEEQLTKPVDKQELINMYSGTKKPSHCYLLRPVCQIKKNDIKKLSEYQIIIIRNYMTELHSLQCEWDSPEFPITSPTTALTKYLRIHPEILDISNNFIRENNLANSFGIHIRRGDIAGLKRGNFGVGAYMAVLNKYLKEDQKIFVATQSLEVIKEFEDKYPNRVIVYSYPESKFDYSPDGVREAVIELLSLSHCQKVILSPSAFSITTAFIHGGKIGSDLFYVKNWLKHPPFKDVLTTKDVL